MSACKTAHGFVQPGRGMGGAGNPVGAEGLPVGELGVGVLELEGVGVNASSVPALLFRSPRVAKTTMASARADAAARAAAVRQRG